MTHTLSITQARGNLPTLVDNAQKKLHEYVITVNGSPAAILMPISEYESLIETNEILANPKLMQDIKEGEKDIQNGNFVTLEEFEKELQL